MFDKNDPNSIKKMVERSKEISLLLQDFRLLVEISRPGSGDTMIQALLMGGVVSMNDEDYNIWLKGVRLLVDQSIHLIERAALDILGANKKEVTEKGPETENDPASLHKKPLN